MKWLVIITGPTGIGKTKLSIKLAKDFNTEIISCDSRQVYKEMSIGTAVPTNEEREGIVHHMLQIISITDYFNAYKYEQQAISIIDELFKKYDILLMTGGTGLYINAILYGIDDIPDVDFNVRKNLSNRLKNEGLEKLQEELKLIDPQIYYKIDINNPKRILKALEIYYTSGKPYSSFLTGKKKQRNFNSILIALDEERDMLYKKIDDRVDIMIKNGLIEEARQLYTYKYLNALNTVGYKELFDYFENKTDLKTAIEKIKFNTHKYARKQLVWLRKYKNNINWFLPYDYEKIKSFIHSNVF